jgi:hypothetical protein
MNKVKVKGNVAGEEERSEPRSQTSVRFKFGAMVKGASLAENIPQPGTENQLKSTPVRSLYHTVRPYCDMSMICQLPNNRK